VFVEGAFEPAMLILLVNSDVTTCFLHSLLQANGYAVVHVADSKTALMLSRNYTGPIDLLLTDVEMPAIDGLDLCRIISAERPDTKLLMISNKVLGQALSEMKGVRFIGAPVTPNSLLRTVMATLG
jgi:CheY-like chemotaxis protein